MPLSRRDAVLAFATGLPLCRAAAQITPGPLRLKSELDPLAAFLENAPRKLSFDDRSLPILDDELGGLRIYAVMLADIFQLAVPQREERVVMPSICTEDDRRAV